MGLLTLIKQVDSPEQAEQPNLLGELLRLEHGVRQLDTLAEVNYFIVNETQAMANCHQIAFIDTRGKHSRLLHSANLVDVDKTAPWATWVEDVADHLRDQEGAMSAHEIQVQELSTRLRRDWVDLSPRHLLWLPMIDPRRGLQGVLLLASDEPWNEQLVGVMQHLAESYAVVLAGFQKRFDKVKRRFRVRWAMLLLLLIAIPCMFLPIRLSVLSPAEIVAYQPYPVTAPMDGVVNKIHVLPNQWVEPDTPLVSMETQDLRRDAELAQKALVVAEAELHQTTQAAFRDARKKAEVEGLKSRVALKQAELAFAQERLQRAEILAPQAGLVLVDLPHDWQGRPVKVGERILQLADPKQVEIELWVDVHDAIALQQGAEVSLFLDIAPLTPIAARITSASYKPQLTAEQRVAYRVTAELQLDEAATVPRIGLRGIAKSHGEEVRLYYYLFRRPITTVAQWLGW